MGAPAMSLDAKMHDITPCPTRSPPRCARSGSVPRTGGTWGGHLSHTWGANREYHHGWEGHSSED
eukprot:2406037-Amphidinium_carterae.1